MGNVEGLNDLTMAQQTWWRYGCGFPQQCSEMLYGYRENTGAGRSVFKTVTMVGKQKSEGIGIG